MSGYILCQTKKAEHPYFIENISTNIYSIEELCYYLYHNVYLIDQTIMNEDLCTWISEELELPKLASKLRANIGKYVPAEDLIYPVFKEINYLSYEELRALHAQLVNLNQEKPAVHRKRKGDSLVENGMYASAIREYHKILDEEDLKGEKEGFRAEVLYNLGCAYSYLFQMEKARECFWSAYEQDKIHAARSERYLKAYLLAYRNGKSKKEYEKKLHEVKADQKLKKELDEEWKTFEKIPETPADSKKLDEMMEKFTKDYHRSTGS